MAGRGSERDDVTDLVGRCTGAIVVGDWLLAHQHVVNGIRQVDELAARDPDDRDASVLGGLYYNGALVLDRLTEAEYSRVGREAWEGRPRAAASLRCAELAVRSYLVVDPSGGDSRRVNAALPWIGGRRRVVADRIAHTADARARLARLLAEHAGVGEAERVRAHGVAALNTYGVLVAARGTAQTRADLNRISAQVLPALQRVGLLP